MSCRDLAERRVLELLQTHSEQSQIHTIGANHREVIANCLSLYIDCFYLTNIEERRYESSFCLLDLTSLG